MSAVEPADRRAEASAFAEVFDSCAPAVLRFAQRRLSEHDAAWDVVTDTFTSAWRHWDQRPEPASVLPWLYAIARNAVRDQQRSAGRRTRLVARLSAATEASLARDPADGVILGMSLAAAIARLSEADRELLRLIAWEQLDDARSIGLVLGISPAAARVRVHRARRRLRALLAESEEPAPCRADSAAPTIAQIHAKET
jgi:RNA polymerase sigma-70 factor, ECF subfamily